MFEKFVGYSLAVIGLAMAVLFINHLAGRVHDAKLLVNEDKSRSTALCQQFVSELDEPNALCVCSHEYCTAKLEKYLLWMNCDEWCSINKMTGAD